jgi:AcrR family transcriptional regulator
MPVPASSRGLRERKKLQTRRAIRREAFRLFDEQGYTNTTVEQIAVAAEVSPRTFYRYFGVKEALLISDDQTPPIVEAFAAAPPELDPVAAYRYAVAAFFGELSQDDRDDAVAGQRLMYEVPEVRGLLYSEYVRLIDLIAEALVRRGDDPADELGRRVIAGAIVGVLLAASHNMPLPEGALLSSLSILGAKLS